MSEETRVATWKLRRFNVHVYVNGIGWLLTCYDGATKGEAEAMMHSLMRSREPLTAVLDDECVHIPMTAASAFTVRERKDW